MSKEHLEIINKALDVQIKSINRAISVAQIPAVEAAFKDQLLKVEEVRVIINQKDFFK